MQSKNIILVISNSQEYIYHTGDDEKKYASQMNKFYESISYVYIPLLNMFSSLEKDGIPFKISLVISPVVCSLLKDPVIQQQYISWLEAKISLGKDELLRCKKDKSRKLTNLVKFYLEKAEEDLYFFTNVYSQDLLKKFSEMKKKGYVELLATCGTNIFLPHYADMSEVLNAQIETGLYSHRVYFGDKASGFWLPEMGYCSGIENVLKIYGVSYTVLDARAFLFSKDNVEKGIFAPVNCNGQIAAFARDNRVDEEVFGKNGYASNAVYCDTNYDIAFELESYELSSFLNGATSRYASGYHYKNKSGENTIYNPLEAIEQCNIDASSFVDKKIALLDDASSVVNKSSDVSVVCAFSVEQFLSNWLEGISWLESIFRYGKNKTVCFSSFESVLSSQKNLQNIKPYYSASTYGGYGEYFLAQKNNWMISHIRKASERMIDLAERFPNDTGLKERLLNMGVRELMICESCGWANMIWDGVFPEYAKDRFKESISAFMSVFESLGSNTVSTEWLTKLEAKHPIFPWINYRIFSKKK